MDFYGTSLSGELAHHGVKGMHWGVRKKYDTYKQIRNAPLQEFHLKTKKGEMMKVKEDRPGHIASALSAASPKYNEGRMKSHFLTMTVDGRKIGDVQTVDIDKHTANLGWMFVKQNERGKGYASAVFDLGVKYHQANGYHKLTLEVPGNAPDARHIYEKKGFKAGKQLTTPEEDPTWGGLTEMSLDLRKKHKPKI